MCHTYISILIGLTIKLINFMNDTKSIPDKKKVMFYFSFDLEISFFQSFIHFEYIKIKRAKRSFAQFLIVIVFTQISLLFIYFTRTRKYTRARMLRVESCHDRVF